MISNSFSISPHLVTVGAGDVVAVNDYNKMLTILGIEGATYIGVSLTEDQPPAQLQAGLQYELPDDGSNFKRIMLHNTTASPIIVELLFSRGRVYDNRLNLEGSVFGDIETATEATEVNTRSANSCSEANQALSAGVAHKIDANTNRVMLLVSNYSSNSNPVYIGFTSGTNATLHFAAINPGGQAPLDEFTGDVYLFSATAQTVYICELVRA